MINLVTEKNGKYNMMEILLNYGYTQIASREQGENRMVLPRLRL